MLLLEYSYICKIYQLNIQINLFTKLIIELQKVPKLGIFCAGWQKLINAFY